MFDVSPANALQPIPPAARPHGIHSVGYTMQQKLEIAKRYLVPEQIITRSPVEDVVITDEARHAW